MPRCYISINRLFWSTDQAKAALSSRLVKMIVWEAAGNAVVGLSSVVNIKLYCAPIDMEFPKRGSMKTIEIDKS